MRALWTCVMFAVVTACGAEHREPQIADATADRHDADEHSADANTNDAVASDAMSAPDADHDGAVVHDATTPTDASDDAVHCDHREVVCRAAEPVCPEMQVASVIGTCWGPCVRIDQCVCSGPQDCPHEETFACHLYRQRCGPYVN